MDLTFLSSKALMSLVVIAFEIRVSRVNLLLCAVVEGFSSKS